MFGICNLSLVPVRKEPSDRSEMVTQLLFGELFEIKEKQKQWVRVHLFYDGYEGWIDEKQFLAISSEEYKKITTAPLITTAGLVEVMSFNQQVFPVVIGSPLPFYEEDYCYINGEKYSYDGPVNFPVHAPERNQVIENSYMYLKSPYLWGGRSPFGIDCSGFTQMVFKMSGAKLPRDAWQQAEYGKMVNLLEEAIPGDLAFFENEEGKIIHTGILLGDHKIIHASGEVRIDAVDHHGIFRSAEKKYSHKLRLVKRIL